MKHYANLILAGILIPIVLLTVLPELLIMAGTYFIWKNAASHRRNRR